MVLGVVGGEILVGISHRAIGAVDLVLSMHHGLNCNIVNSDGGNGLRWLGEEMDAMGE